MAPAREARRDSFRILHAGTLINLAFFNIPDPAREAPRGKQCPFGGNPYKTLLKAVFWEGPDHGALTLIKPIVYEGFHCHFSENVLAIIGKALRS